ncbi:MAG: hypothetical protein N2489_01800 [Clostridia bacterium]|nr:hypothetical protein [Clostridia bacterium]
MACHNIMGVLINHRTKQAPKVQEILTKHGCCIKMRIGLHETDNVCSNEGLVLLQLSGTEGEIKALEDDLNSLEGIKAQNMKICSD